MKKSAIILGVFFAISSPALSGIQAEVTAAKNKIISATNSLAGLPGSAITQGQIVNSLLELLDTAAALSSDNPYKEEIQFRIKVAKDLIRKDSLFNDKARQYLSFAYRMMTNGKKFEVPKHLDEFVTPAEFQEKSLTYLRALIVEAVKSLDAGDKGSTAVLLLEMVLMTMTPAQG